MTMGINPHQKQIIVRPVLQVGCLLPLASLCLLCLRLFRS